MDEKWAKRPTIRWSRGMVLTKGHSAVLKEKIDRETQSGPNFRSVELEESSPAPTEESKIRAMRLSAKLYDKYARLSENQALCLEWQKDLLKRYETSKEQLSSDELSRFQAELESKIHLKTEEISHLIEELRIFQREALAIHDHEAE